MSAGFSGWSKWKQAAIDRLSWWLPILSAILAVVSGFAALQHADASAALLGIAGGVVGALGVLFTNFASHIRDQRLAMAMNVADAASDMAYAASDKAARALDPGVGVS